MVGQKVGRHRAHKHLTDLTEWTVGERHLADGHLAELTVDRKTFGRTDIRPDGRLTERLYVVWLGLVRLD